MKKIYLSILGIFLCVITFAQGIRFDEISVQEALIKAEKEKKLVFVDMCASWCVPCKMIASTLFMEREVGEYFNAHFVNVKCDIDTKEGKVLRKKYGIHKVPTFLILQPDGEIRQFMLGGSRQKDEFIEWASRGLKKESSLPYIEELVKRGRKMSKQNLSDYFVILEARRDFSDSVRYRLFRMLSKKERCQAKYWNLFRDQFGDTRYFYFVEKNIDAFRENVGREKIDTYLFKGYDKIIRGFMYNKVGDTRSMEIANKICTRLSNITLSYTEDDLDKNQDGSQRMLLVRAKLLKSYLNEDKQEMIQNLRVLTQSGLWWNTEWFPIAYIGEHGTREEQGALRDLGKVIIMDLCNRKEQWVFSQKFKELGIPISCFDALLKQAKAEAAKQTKPLLLEVVLPSDASCKEMSRLVDLPGMVEKVFALCVPVRVDASGLDGLPLRLRLGISTYPAYVLLTPEEEVIHQWTGGGTQEHFLDQLREGVEKTTTYRYLNHKN